jgi:thiamine-phosphate pyrophosphorylase
MAQPPRLLVITPPKLDAVRVCAVLPSLADAVDGVLLRWPQATAREVLEAARQAAAISPRPPLLLSDRADLAWAAQLEGVHLRDGGLPPDRLRAWGFRWVGMSCHPARDAAAPLGADYVTASPVFATTSKPSVEPIGLDTLAHYCEATPLPVLALGGLDASRVQACRQAGAHGVAVLSAVWNAPDPVAAANSIAAALGRAND